MIKCNKCEQEKDSSEFYPRNRVCKECTKARVAAYVKTEKGMIVKRMAAKKYSRTDSGRVAQSVADKNYKSKPSSKKKAIAKWAVKRAITSGLISKGPCEVCGCTGAVGHHDDYDRQLDVRWLCPIHHKEWHMVNGEGANAL
ncbi:MAG: hypothetical protein ACRCXB_34745 [Aeromonadaceae bacterium]